MNGEGNVTKPKCDRNEETRERDGNEWNKWNRWDGPRDRTEQG
jgi:hypothetical protein